jgi:hypothetical protein
VSVTDLPFDLVLLLLRVVFVFLLYFFLYQVVRVISRELGTASSSGAVARASGPGGRPPQAALTLIDADQSGLPLGSTYVLQSVSSIGRAADNVVPIADAFVSSHHARLVQTNGRWYLTDLDSTNGTFINGTPAGPVAAAVANGDVLQFGRVKLRLNAP